MTPDENKPTLTDVEKAIKAAKVVGFADLGMEAIYEFDAVSYTHLTLPTSDLV